MINISFIKFLNQKFPKLNSQLKKARISSESEEFIKKTLVSASYATIGSIFIIFLLISRAVQLKTLLIVLVSALPIFFLVFFFYFFQLPIVKISKINKEINKEIVFAGRFLVVELQSGVTLYDAMKNLKKSYPVVGTYFMEIINKIDVGTAIEDAVTEAIELSPSDSLTKLMWQISNSLRTGSDVAQPLTTVVETLIKEQQIMVNEYARKLNPLAMFYMLIAIIVPSLGVTMLTIIAIFAGLQLNLSILLIIVGMNAFLQFMFVAMINSARPPVEL